MYPNSYIGDYVKIVNVGTCMNYGHIEEYAKNSANGWSYGISTLMIQDSHIQSHNFISMLELEEKYDERQNDKKNNATNEQEG